MLGSKGLNEPCLSQPQHHTFQEKQIPNGEHSIPAWERCKQGHEPWCQVHER